MNETLKLSSKGLALIHGFEKCKLEAYNDNPKNPEKGKWTIGWGNTYYEDGTPVKQGDVITQERADKLFDIIVAKFEAGVKKRITVPLIQQEFDSLVSLAYNAGFGYRDSYDVYHDWNLWKNINNNMRGENLRAYWHKLAITQGGEPSRGLVRRRKAEAHLCVTGEVNFFED